MPKRLGLLLAALVVWAAPLAAKTYSAESYDVRMQVLDDGSVRVTETIVLNYQDGTFRGFLREIPTRRTDGIEFVSASLNGRVLPRGDGVGEVEVSGGSRHRIRWRFDPVEQARYMFTVTYLVRGLVRQDAASDQLIWHALPSDHDYTIASSAIAVETSAALAADPAVSARRVGASTIVPSERGVVVSATDIGRDGFVQVNLRFAAGSLITEPPAWQQREMEARASAPFWAAGGIGLFLLGLIPFGALRTRYQAPPRDRTSVHGEVRRRPDDVWPALAGALVAGGKTTSAHAMATLFDLARQGVVTITQTKRTRFSRSFEVKQVEDSSRLSETERAVLDVAFTKKGHREDAANLSKAAGRLSRKISPVRDAVRRAMKARNLWHDDRAHSRKQHLVTSGIVALAGVAAVIPAVLFIDRYMGWPLLVPAGLFLAAVVGLVLAERRTPLSNDGLKQAAAWKAFKKHLQAVGSDKARLEPGQGTALLPFAVALGLGSVWARHLKKHPDEMPDWFQGWSPDDGAAALTAMIAGATASSGSGGGAGAGGAAAGGGASGAS